MTQPRNPEKKPPIADALKAVAKRAIEAKFVNVDLRRLVDEARASGATWTELGAAMGVTRQAAVQRFGGPKSGRMFERELALDASIAHGRKAAL